MKQNIWERLRAIVAKNYGLPSLKVTVHPGKIVSNNCPSPFITIINVHTQKGEIMKEATLQKLEKTPPKNLKALYKLQILATKLVLNIPSLHFYANK